MMHGQANINSDNLVTSAINYYIEYHMNVLLVCVSANNFFFFHLEEILGRNLEKETFFIIMKQLLKFFIFFSCVWY